MSEKKITVTAVFFATRKVVHFRNRYLFFASQSRPQEGFHFTLIWAAATAVKPPLFPFGQFLVGGALGVKSEAMNGRGEQRHSCAMPAGAVGPGATPLFFRDLYYKNRRGEGTTRPP